VKFEICIPRLSSLIFIFFLTFYIIMIFASVLMDTCEYFIRWRWKKIMRWRWRRK